MDKEKQQGSKQPRPVPPQPSQISKNRPSDLVSSMRGGEADVPVSFVQNLTETHPELKDSSPKASRFDQLVLDGQSRSKRIDQLSGKSRHPDYARFSIVLNKNTRKWASRIWEDMEPKKDLSDLIELLLQRFINEQKSELTEAMHRELAQQPR